MTAGTEATGVVIAGGGSTRFDAGEKALATVGGEPMLRRVADRVAPAVDALVINCRADQRVRFADALAGIDPEPTFAVDPVPDRGPLAGVETALSAVGTDHAVLLACDLPLVRTPALEGLLDRLEPADADRPDCVLPTVEGRRQPLCGAYAVGPLADALASIPTADRGLCGLLARLESTTVPASTLPGGPSSFRNVNTSGELATVREVV